jgi:putative signal transducing protein
MVDKKRMRSAAPEVKPSGGTAPVPVAVVGTTSEAELIVGMLRSNNVRAAVSADDAGGQEPELQLQGVRVLVAAADAAEARRLIAAADDTV